MKNIYTITLLGLALCSGCRRDDPRLYGTWKSDIELSMSWNRAHAGIPDEQLLLLGQSLGHLTYTKYPNGTGVIEMEPYTFCVGTNKFAMSGSTNTFTYKVVKQTEKATAVKTTAAEYFMAESVVTIHFDNPDTCWVYVYPDNPNTSPREYFKRIK